MNITYYKQTQENMCLHILGHYTATYKNACACTLLIKLLNVNILEHYYTIQHYGKYTFEQC